MYLRRLYVENSGPVERLALEMPFTEAGLPKPVVLVGANGSGKTNVLSIVADALFEAAAMHFTDVVNDGASMNRPWFRVNGGLTIRYGATGACALAEFINEDAVLHFKDKSGRLDPAALRERVDASFHPHLNWAVEGAVKEINISGEVSKSIFERGVYLFFPSSRAETPHWLNRDSLPRDDIDLTPRFSNRLRKPIYVERGLDQLKQWMLALLIDIRADIQLAVRPDGSLGPAVSGVADNVFVHKATWQSLNQILGLILDDPSARFVWAGRQASVRFGITRGDLGGLFPIEALSAGQSTLLNMFGTLLRYGDGTTRELPMVPASVAGICVIDEVDAHLHVDLQHRALPALIKMFPRMQFVLSSHSPLLALGMEGSFGTDGMMIVDMPSGAPILAEAYAEFGKALDALRNSQAFGNAILEFAGQEGKLSVLLEGETDPIYLKTAAELLGKGELLERVEFAWVGAKDPKSGQGFHTGKDALNHTANVLRAKPTLMKRPVLLLYDNDAQKEPADFPSLHIRSMPTNAANAVVENGIENLLPPGVIDGTMFDEKVSKRKNAMKVVTTTLNKMRLCGFLCSDKRDASDFLGFLPVLEMIEGLAPSVKTSPKAVAP